MKIKKTRLATYLDYDVWQWIVNKARKLRISESAVVQQVIAEKMENEENEPRS